MPRIIVARDVGPLTLREFLCCAKEEDSSSSSDGSSIGPRGARFPVAREQRSKRVSGLPQQQSLHTSSQRQQEETSVRPESFNYDFGRTSKRDFSHSRRNSNVGQAPNSGTPPQLGNITTGRTNAPSESRADQRTSVAEMGNMNRTFIQGFKAPER